LATTLVATVFLAGTVAVPLIEMAGSSGAGLLRLCYAPVCHQIPARSMTIGAGTQAVCARCSGLYLGGVAGLLAGGLLVGTGRRPRPLWLGVLLVPTVVDAGLTFAGLPSLPNLPRLLVAVPPGFLAGLFLAGAIAELAAPRPASRLTRPMKPAGAE
jgi:uncharacterized membrane protein